MSRLTAVHAMAIMNAMSWLGVMTAARASTCGADPKSAGARRGPVAGGVCVRAGARPGLVRGGHSVHHCLCTPPPTRHPTCAAMR
jgi:hypothetical protein